MAKLFFLFIISKILIILIRIYQILINPIIGKNCRFNPTCSEYGIKVINKYYFIKGIWLILKRILKCHSLYIDKNEFVSYKPFEKREK